MNPTTVICIAVGLFILGLLLGKVFFGNTERISQKVSGNVLRNFDSMSWSKLINHEIAVENKSLVVENQELGARVDFFMWLFIRYFIVEYEHYVLRSGSNLIYTHDALTSMRLWAETALKNYQDTWGGKSCNEYCDWTKEFMEYLIDWVNKVQKDNIAFFYIDDEYERAFQRFFEYFNNIPSSDRLNIEHGHKTSKLGYWRPQGPFYGTIDEG